jgi:predicted hydrocarbon binding protein
MRFVKISQKELEEQRKLYESVMSNACHGLFFREGIVFGPELTAESIKDRDNYFENVKKGLVERGWLEDITFDGNNITVKGSIEVSPGGELTCHRLRGILRHIFETYNNERLYCAETECASAGGEQCVFKIETIE